MIDKVGLIVKKKNWICYCCVFLLTLFIDIIGVQAACSDGVVCEYSFCGQRGSASDPGYLAQNCSNTRVGQVNMHIVFRCSDSSKSAADCDSFVSWAYAYKNSVNSSDGTGYKEINSWGNYDYLFHRTDDLFGDYFKKEKGFSCPNIYVSLSNTTSNDTYTFGYVKPSGIQTSVSTTNPNDNDPNWLNNFNAWNGMPASGRKISAKTTCINNSTDLEAMKNKLVEETSNEVINEVQKQEESYNEHGQTVNIENIISWANLSDWTINDLGDPCNIIKGELVDFLKTAFWIISIAGIILVVVMTAISFIKAIVGSDDEKFRDAIKHLYTRIIVIIILLLLPVLLSFIIDLINNMAGEGVVKIGADENIFCDVSDA